tara:strand:- start:2910 stop:3041 length:132 start_codon:yes stop_codon:yes gene_type:complete
MEKEEQISDKIMKLLEGETYENSRIILNFLLESIKHSCKVTSN